MIKIGEWVCFELYLLHHKYNLVEDYHWKNTKQKTDKFAAYITLHEELIELFTRPKEILLEETPREALSSSLQVIIA